MTRLSTLLGEALGALDVSSHTSYVWLGQRFQLGLDGDEGPGRLARELQARLYSDFYCSGGPAPAVELPGAVVPLQASEHHGFSSANTGRGSRNAGWRVAGFDRDEIVVERDGLHVWAAPDEVLDGGAATVGAPVVVVAPKESLGLGHTFYTAYGDAGTGAEDGGAIDRFYWNVRAEGRAALVAAVSSRLNGAGLRFRLKVLNDPELARCDAGVLYTPAGERPAVVEALPGIASALASYLHQEVPVFTLPLATGIGFAEDPGREESFGQHRCRLLVEGAVDAHVRGAADLAARLAICLQRWEREGLSAEFPHLNPGSDPARAPAALGPQG